MKKIIIISVILAFISAFIYVSYSAISSRYFSETNNATQEVKIIKAPETPKSPNSSNQDALPTNETPAEKEETSAENSSATDSSGEKIYIKANITPQQCKDRCKAFSEDPKFFAYCEQVCGISPVENVSNCDGKKDLEKDYCQKDLAITKSDASLCESIKDDNIRQTCKNRIAEDMLEKM